MQNIVIDIETDDDISNSADLAVRAFFDQKNMVYLLSLSGFFISHNPASIKISPDKADYILKYTRLRIKLLEHSGLRELEDALERILYKKITTWTMLMANFILLSLIAKRIRTKVRIDCPKTYLGFNASSDKKSTGFGFLNLSVSGETIACLMISDCIAVLLNIKEDIYESMEEAYSNFPDADITLAPGEMIAPVPHYSTNTSVFFENYTGIVKSLMIGELINSRGEGIGEGNFHPSTVPSVLLYNSERERQERVLIC